MISFFTKRSARIAAAGILFTATMATPGADAGVLGLPAQEFTQLANWVQLVQQLITEAQQLQQVTATVQWAVYNSKNLVKHPFTAIMSDLTALGDIVSKSQGLAYTLGSMDQQFAHMYPDYDPHGQWFASYANWSANTLKTLNGTLSSAGMQGVDLLNEQQTLQQLRLLTSSPIGQNEAAQIAAISSQEVVSQLIKLRQLTIEDIAAKAAYTGQQINQEKSKQQASQNGFPGTDWQSDQRSW